MSSYDDEHPKLCSSGCFVGLWVDDVRPTPDHLQNKGWCRARSFHEAITKLELMDYHEISLDHDLASFYGNREMTGYDIVMWLVARKQQGGYVPSIIHVHSANPVGRKNIQDVVNQYFPPIC